MTSRERMLTAISNGIPDYVPCCFMIFRALRNQCGDQYEFVRRQLSMGLDAMMEIPVRPNYDRKATDHADLHGLPVRYDSRVEIKEWREERSDSRYPILHKEYITPAGALTTAVNKTDDWIHEDHVPFLDDYLIPRYRKPLVTSEEDLPALRYLLAPLGKDDIERFRGESKRAIQFAREQGVIAAGGWGAVVDLACWLCGMEELILLAVDFSDFVHELIGFIFEWNRQRMELILESGVDLFIRRGWHEGTDIWSPRLFREFIFPTLVEDAELAHEHGAKFGYIMTTGMMPIADMIIEAGVDVILGIDPVQGKGVEMNMVKRKFGGKVCLWGGVNGFITIERGSPEDVKEAVRLALDILAPDGGFILSPVDNVVDTSENTWRNIEMLIKAWRAGRDYR